jgi:hypothetical protein
MRGLRAYLSRAGARAGVLAVLAHTTTSTSMSSSPQCNSEVAALCLTEDERVITAMMETMSVSSNQPRITEMFPRVKAGARQVAGGPIRTKAAAGAKCASKAGRDTPYTRLPPAPPALTTGVARSVFLLAPVPRYAGGAAGRMKDIARG